MSKLKLVSNSIPIKQAFNYVPEDTYRHSPFCQCLYRIAEGIQEQFMTHYGTGVKHDVHEKHVDNNGQILLPTMEVDGIDHTASLVYHYNDENGAAVRVLTITKSLDISRLTIETFSVEDNLIALKETLEVMRVYLKETSEALVIERVISQYMLPTFALICFNDIEYFAIGEIFKHGNGFIIWVRDVDNAFKIDINAKALIKLTTRPDLLPLWTGQ